MATNINRSRIRALQVKRFNAHTSSVKVSFESGAITTSAGGVSSWYLPCDPQSYGSTQMAAIADTFQYYRYRNFNVTWVPLVGATSPGVVKFATSDNPEVIYKIVSGTYAAGDYNTLSSQLPNARRATIWQETMYSAPQDCLNRRQKFSIDSSTVSSAEIADRTVQSIVLGYVTGVASTNVGYFTIDATLDFYDIIPVTSSPLFKADTPPEGHKPDCSKKCPPIDPPQ